jgi:hypothetical protein
MDFNCKVNNTMEEPIKIESWEKFEEELVRINAETISRREETQRHVDYPIFRGHSSSKWHLESTLDRIQKGMRVSDYYRIIESVHKNIETCAGKKWEIDAETTTIGFKLRAYEFSAYLRHNGFPSPLTDWTRSPYIAAYFAFRDVFSPRQPQEHVSIFVYRESAGAGKSGWGDKPHICFPGPTISTDYKHYLQQSEYLFCVKEESIDKPVFANYEDVPPHENQDVLVKYNIPISEQQKVLRKLDSMNITAYSLFNSESSLMETLAVRELFLK